MEAERIVVFGSASLLASFPDLGELAGSPLQSTYDADLIPYPFEEEIGRMLDEAFGEDRVIFATNWGVCEHFGKVEDVVRIVKEFLESKGGKALRKGMRENAIRVYGIPKENLR